MGDTKNMKIAWGISIAAHILLVLVFIVVGISFPASVRTDAPGSMSLTVLGGGSGHAGQEFAMARNSSFNSSVNEKQQQEVAPLLNTPTDTQGSVVPKLAESSNSTPKGVAGGQGEADANQTAGGVGDGKGRGNSSGTGAGEGDGNNPFAGSGFLDNGDGTYTAGSPDGIDYKIIQAVDPVYPQEAIDAFYNKGVTVQVRFVVGLNGYVESIEILNEIPNLGFAQATRQALQQWRFEPITYKGITIKCVFRKNFRFYPK